jgi:hypothetical protein
VEDPPGRHSRRRVPGRDGSPGKGKDSMEVRGRMKRNTWIRRAVVLLAAAALSWAWAVPAAADDDAEKISSVKIRMELAQPEAGSDVAESLMDAFSVPGDAPYTVTDAEYVNGTDDSWVNGTRPVIDVTLEPESDDYEFGGGLKVQMDSATATESCRVRSRKKDEAVVRIKLKNVRGTIDEPENPTWAGATTASWDPVDGAKNYRVKLFLDDAELATVSTTGSTYDFARTMTRAGTYYFEVKACASKSADDSDWSEDSENQVISAEEAAREAAGASGAGKNTGVSGTSASTVRLSGAAGSGWALENGSWICRVDGKTVQDAWVLDTDGSWYRMGADGRMLTGWYRDTDGRWYFLRESAGEKYPLGSMKTGWYRDQNAWYYLSDGAEDLLGAMVTGSRTIGGRRYTFAESGKLYGNRETD